MTKVELLPSGKVVDVPPGTELLVAAREAQVELDSPCGGKGTCGKCIVRVTAGSVDSDSLGVLPPAAVADGYVLACKSRVLNAPVSVEIPTPSGRDGGRFTEEDETYLVRHELLPSRWEFDPLAVKWLIDVPPPQPEDGLGDLDRLVRAIKRQWGKTWDVVCTLGVIRRLANVVREFDGQVTVTLIRDESKLHVTRIEAGDQATRHYSIAVDVGTTTVALQLINPTVAKILSTRSAYNDQVTCGLDVISRINYAHRPGRLEELRARVLKTVNGLLEKALDDQGIDPGEISNVVISGNTTMAHLLLGLNPEHIRLAPYTPTVLQVPYLSAEHVGIAINPDSWVYFSPAVGSYVGGDITAGLLCTDLATDSNEISLFVDIGTNGELVVGNRDFLLGCACSAGPAFEGGGIECGMRASVGAIEHVEIEADTGACRYTTIGNVAPRGICGSGMIALVANLLQTGWIDPAGKLDRERSSSCIEVEGRRARYVLVPDEEAEGGTPITISEADIENIIRAKAAIYSASALMLEHLGIGFEDLSRIYVAGGFGRFLDLEKAITLGLMPDVPREKFQFIGNASLLGSYMVVVSQEYRERQLELAQRMTYIDLSSEPGYMDQYTAALFLPHTDPGRFPSASGAAVQPNR